MALLNVVVTLAAISFIDFSAEGSECCTSYNDEYGDRQSSQWCSKYCCYKVKLIFIATTELECCDSYNRRASSYERTDTCAQWWSEHAWVPMLISMGCITAISLCCFGCIKLCSNNNRPGAVVTQAPQPAVLMMTGQQQVAYLYPSSSFQTQGAYPPGAYPQEAYPPGAYPAGPPPYGGQIPQKSTT